jgi:preprotein translocase subunit YajC
MNLFETTAYAAEGAAPGDAGLINLLFLGGFVLIFYFLLWRPQSKRRKEH